MKHAAWILVLCLSAASLLAGEGELNKPPEGFTAIFNGTDLTGWWGATTEDPAKYMAMPAEEFAKKRAASLLDIQKHWSVDKGELVNDGKGLYLTTDKYYGDFELWVDYKTVAQADSGIYLRGIPQVQIWDFTKEGGKWNIGADKGSGGLWNNSKDALGKDPLVLADKPFGEWNRFRIVIVGERVTIFLNERLVVDHARMENYFARTSAVYRTGPIQLQTHGGEIRWRNVFLKEIKGEQANEILRNGGVDKKPADDNYTSLFNGKDLAGWKGPVDNYEVVDGAIVCKAGKGGTIFAPEIYKDFSVKVEFKLPPGGNNGLALRYPGEGDTAYTGLCELQVLDEHEKYAKLDARQFHGSVYGMAAATRGFLRPVGEWNYQEVIVKGSTIYVELNGTRILNTDLGKITEFMGGKPHPGKDRTEGHFGFAGHNDPVAFKNVRIKKL